MNKDLLEKKLLEKSYDITVSGAIFGNRFIIVDKFIDKKDGSKLVVFFDLFEGKTHIKDIAYFTYITVDMGVQFTKDIINIDYANNEREDS